MKKKFFADPRGGLNLDDDASALPEGDYIDAKNIDLNHNSEGGGLAFKKIVGFNELDSAYTPPFSWTGTPRVVDSFADQEDRSVFFLIKDDTYATVFKYDISGDSFSIALPRYPHSSTSIVANLRKLGDMLFWNYLGEGVPMSWLLTRTFTDTDILDPEDLWLIKKAPSGALYVQVTTDANGGIDLLEKNDLEFTYRFVYDSGERSVLCQPYTMVKGRPDATSFIIQSFNSFPDYVTDIEVYVRKSNSGSWQRIKTQSTAGSLTWKGELNETLDTDAEATPFHQIPLTSQGLEVIKNRLFLAHNVNDLVNDMRDEITISIDTVTNDYELTFNASGAVSYFASTVTVPDNADLNDRTDNDWVMPFANLSSYAIGLAYFDGALRTPGVDKHEVFQTGNFDYPILPSIDITFSGANKAPSWAKYFAICVSNNLTMDRFFEGFASNIFFRASVEGSYKYIPDSFDPDGGVVDTMVVDISGMLAAKQIYTYQEGDIMIISTTRIINSNSKKKKFNVVGQDGPLVFVEFEDVGEIYEGPSFNTSWKSYEFIIYSPSQATENIVFYPTYKLYDVADLDAATSNIFNTNFGSSNHVDRLVGDCVFKTISFRPYVQYPLSPSETTSFAKTTFGRDNYTDASFEINGSNPQYIPVTDIFVNNDQGSISGNYYRTGKTYPQGGKIIFSANVYLEFASEPSQETIFLFSVRKSGGTFTTSSRKQLPHQEEDGTYFVRATLGLEYDFTSGELTSSEDIAPFMQIFGTSMTGCTLEVQQVSVSLYDNDVKVSGLEMNYDTPVAAEGTEVLIRAQSLISTLNWNKYRGMPLLESPSTPIRTMTNQIKHGGKYLEGILINNISNFTALTASDIPSEMGPIRALIRASKSQAQGSVMLCISESDAASIYIEEAQIRDAGDTTLLGLSTSVIGSINPLKGGYGTTHPTSVVMRSGRVYFWDDHEKKLIRYSNDGLTPISDIKMESHFLSMTGTPIAAYDPFREWYIVWFEGHSDENAIVWDAKNNRWRTYLQMKSYASSFLDGIMYNALSSGGTIKFTKNQGGSNYNVFYPGETPYASTIKFVLASEVPTVPLNARIRHNSDVINYSNPNYVKSNLLELALNNENGQLANIVSEMWLMERKVLFAHFLRDENSPGGKIEGDYLEGYRHEIEMKMVNASPEDLNQLAIIGLSIEYQESSGHNL